MSPLGAGFVIFALLGGVVSQVYREVPQRRTVALCGLTMLFWAYVDLRSLAVLLLTAAWVQFVSRRILACRDTQLRRRWQRTGVLMVVVVLLGWRAVPSVLENGRTLGLFDVWIDTWWQPLGVALLALQAVACIIDVGRRDMGEMTYAESVLVCGFFPRALAGPLVRAAVFCAELRAPWNGYVPLERVGVLIMAAAVKRYVLSETMSLHVALVTASRETEGKIDLVASWLSGGLFYITDLSAYTDLAIAAALVCGLTLPPNFRAPFSGWTIGEVMRRWHMSISGFFRDYVLVSLRGGSRDSWRLSFAVVGTFLCIAAWHSISLPTLLWGVAIGVPVAIETVRSKRQAERRERRPAAPTGVRRWVMALCAFGYFAAASTLFPAGDIVETLRVYPRLVTHGFFDTSLTSPFVWAVIVLAWMSGAGLFAWLGRLMERTLSVLPGAVAGVVVALVVTFTAGLAGGGIPQFLYQRL